MNTSRYRFNHLRSRRLSGGRITTSRRRRRNTWFFGAIVVVFVLLVVGAVIGGFVAYNNSERVIETVVTDKERICDRQTDGTIDCKYLVFTEAGTFELTDTLGIFTGDMRFDSSDVYGRIDEGPARIRVIGWRLPLLSGYPNIVEIDQEGLS